VGVLTERLKQPAFQQLATTVLGEIGPDAADAVPALVGQLNAKDADIRRETILALAGIGPGAKAATGDLVKLLDEKDFQYRGAAAFALGKIGAADATAALKKSLEADDPMLRLASVWALLQLDPTNDEYAKIAVPRLGAALSVDRPRVRREAAAALGRLGPKASGAVAQLQKALQDDVPEVRLEAVVALAEIGSASQPAVQDLTALVNGDDPVARKPAAYALGRIGSGAKDAVPALRRLQQSRDRLEQTVAAWALVQIAPDADIIKMTVPLMIEALKNSPRADMRVEAARTLGQIGAGSEAAREALTAASKDADEAVRKAATDALARLKK
jgi:HEAT repeat protein